jgi:polyisoprenoid-binding protein YceI
METVELLSAMRFQSMLRHLGVLGLSLVVMQAAVGWSRPLAFKVPGGAGDAVSFTSNAPVEIIHGNTNQISGEVLFDDSFKFDARHPFKINFSVDLTRIDTGMDMRNEHMRTTFLETAQYPRATFQAERITLDAKPDLRKSQTVKLAATGNFTVHGVTVQKTIPLTVAYTPRTAGKPATIRIVGKFPVPLEQHHIKRPEALFVRLADTVYVDLDMKGIAQ